ncbi:MAG: hypothetical protein RL134_1202 [Actinomycetota bacterium]
MRAVNFGTKVPLHDIFVPKFVDVAKEVSGAGP